VIDTSIQSIIIKSRKRSLNTEKVTKLAESINRLGLLHPIAIDEHFNLLAGLHRIEACKSLGWQTIPAIIRQNGDALLAELTEIDENLIRNELTVLEQGEHLNRRDEVLTEMGMRAKQGDNRFTNDRGAESAPLKTTADIAAEVGIPKRRVQERKQIASKITDEVKDAIRDTELADKATDLLQLARLEPEAQKDAVKRVLTGKARNVKQAAKQAKKEKQIDDIKTTIWPVGKYHVIAVDPAWDYQNRASDESHRAANPYPSMGVEEIISLQVPGLALDDCVLWLWTTNAFMEEAHQIARAWGFEQKTILTWVKDRMGTGDWLRGQTEHCLMCVKGKPVVNLANQTTVIYGPLREHSRKPDSFYQLVETLCPGQKVELFARQTREGWTPYGNELNTF
jgi:N6-adenosine-specific RNA methylase IME4